MDMHPFDGKLQRRVLPMLFGMLLLIQVTLVGALELAGMNYSTTYTARPHIVSFQMGPPFFRMSGGIAFTQTAIGEDGWTLKDLHYDSERVDGDRLQATLERNGQLTTVQAHIFDWQLVPLVNFVRASDGESAVTLFGELVDKEAERRVRSDKNMIINFHPAFENTLLGLRLLQADLLLIDRRAADLFKDEGQYILGTGEIQPTEEDVIANRARFDTVRAWLSAQDDRVQSYVVGDIENPVSYRANDGRLRFSGAPRWFAWRDSDEVHIERLDVMVAVGLHKFLAESVGAATLAVAAIYDSPVRDARASQELYKYLVDQGSEEDSALAEELTNNVEKLHASLVRSLERLYKTHPEGKRFLNAAGRLEPQERSDFVDGVLRPVGEMGDHQWERVQTAWMEVIDDPRFREASRDFPVTYLTELSDRLSAMIAEENGINPTVYAALKTSMHYTALLKLYKQQDRAGFARLAAELSEVSATPQSPKDYAVKTPTVYPRGRDLRRLEQEGSDGSR